MSEEELAKEVLWDLFVGQFTMNHSKKFPRCSGLGDYIRKDRLDWLEGVGRKEAAKQQDKIAAMRVEPSEVETSS